MKRRTKQGRRASYVKARLIERHMLYWLGEFAAGRQNDPDHHGLFMYARSLDLVHDYLRFFGPEFEGDPDVEAEIEREDAFYNDGHRCLELMMDPDADMRRLREFKRYQEKYPPEKDRTTPATNPQETQDQAT